jgi:hypothetical protein
MTLADIKALPVGHLARQNAIVLLWSMGAMLPQALDVLDAWGAKYLSQIVWRRAHDVALQIGNCTDSDQAHRSIHPLAFVDSAGSVTAKRTTMQDMKYGRFPRFVISLTAFALIFYSAYSSNAELVRKFAVSGAQAACQQRSDAQRPPRESDCSPENAVVLESAVFDRRMAEAHDPLTLALIAVGCLFVVSVANLLIG